RRPAPLQHPVVQARGETASEPHRERTLRELFLCALDDVRPGPFSGFLERCDRHSYPQRLSTVVETLWGKRWRHVVRIDAPGERGRTIALRFSPPPRRRGLLSHFLVHRTRRGRSSATGPAWENVGYASRTARTPLVRARLQRKIAMSKRRHT